MNDLEIFSREFREWRQNRQHMRYPKLFWDRICKLSKDWPISAIAKACEINPAYLRYKLLKESKPKPIAFAQVQIAPLQSLVAIEFVDRNSCPMTIRFQADHEQLARMILSLSGPLS